MLDWKDRYSPKPEDGTGYSRDFCVNIGRLETLARGTRVRVWYARAYHVGAVSTRIPGGCYWVKLDRKIGGISRVILECSNFGGLASD